MRAPVSDHPWVEQPDVRDGTLVLAHTYRGRLREAWEAMPRRWYRSRYVTPFLARHGAMPPDSAEALARRWIRGNAWINRHNMMPNAAEIGDVDGLRLVAAAADSVAALIRGSSGSPSRILWRSSFTAESSRVLSARTMVVPAPFAR